MSSYNKIEKIKYTDNASDVVSLDEYIIFGDERAEKKYIVFKFENNVDQQLLGMEFEVSQYNTDGDLIEKSVVIYHRFLSKANSTFVPDAKLKVDYACASISVRLIKAAFDRVLWNEGEYSDNSYKFEHFVRDEEYIEGRAAQEAKLAATTKPKQPERIQPFSSRNITRKNIARFPAVFQWFVCIVVIVFVAVSLYIFKGRSKKFTYEGYALKKISDTAVSVYGLPSNSGGTVEIPATIGDYAVRQIDKGAFRNASAEHIIIRSPSLIISEGAFENCGKLIDVTAGEGCNVIVRTRAFQGCTSLASVDLPNGYLEANSFAGSTRVTSVACREFDTNKVKKFTDLFGGGKHEVRVNYFECETTLPEDFFDGVIYFG